MLFWIVLFAVAAFFLGASGLWRLCIAACVIWVIGVGYLQIDARVASGKQVAQLKAAHPASQPSGNFFDRFDAPSVSEPASISSAAAITFIPPAVLMFLALLTRWIVFGRIGARPTAEAQR
jgi:hypothetical protein